MAERNQVKIRLQTKAGISQWQDTRFFNTDSSVALLRFRTPFANVTSRSNSVRHRSRRLGVPPTGRHAGSVAPATPRTRRRASRCRTTVAAPADAPCRCTTHLRSQQLDHPPKHLYPSTSSSTPPPSIGITLPQRNNSNSSVDKAIMMHPHAAGQLHSSIRPSVILHRHDAFLS